MSSVVILCFFRSTLSLDRLNELSHFIIQCSKGQIMSNSFNLVSKSIAALQALLHWQFYPAAMKLLSGQQQRSVTVELWLDDSKRLASHLASPMDELIHMTVRPDAEFTLCIFFSKVGEK